ncbi:unnamed protein product [Ostreobium quekettii]|uniref:Uncharacterized protein n=1 Tax=Ostreobium quekettii TaxID=121088 RepID=A0A8S1IVB9_9CHLO|nr:unnamed protein product [Ostreobium quekettii]|eukprot:evm.model.scf_776EXC.4 EVM.evm.TU.scf_776EXC.4   scf_776EXC:32652-34075(+)
MRGSAGLQASFMASLQAAGDDPDDPGSPPRSPPVPQPRGDRTAARSPPGSPTPARQATPAAAAVHHVDYSQPIDFSRSGPGEGSSSQGPPPAKPSVSELKPASKVSMGDRERATNGLRMFDLGWMSARMPFRGSLPPGPTARMLWWLAPRSIDQSLRRAWASFQNGAPPSRLRSGVVPDLPQAHGALLCIPEASPDDQKGSGGGSDGQPTPAVAAAAHSPARKRKADGPLPRGSPKPLKPASPVKKGGPRGGSPKHRGADRAYKRAVRRAQGGPSLSAQPQGSAGLRISAPQVPAPPAPPNPTPAAVGTVPTTGQVARAPKGGSRFWGRAVASRAARVGCHGGKIGKRGSGGSAALRAPPTHKARQKMQDKHKKRVGTGRGAAAKITQSSAEEVTDRTDQPILIA